LIWRLATSLDPKSRNPRRAVELAKEAVQLFPKIGYYWTMLSTAYASAGEWKSAIDAAQEAMKLGPGGRGEFLLLRQAPGRRGPKGGREERGYAGGRGGMAWPHPTLRWPQGLGRVRGLFSGRPPLPVGCERRRHRTALGRGNREGTPRFQRAPGRGSRSGL